MVIQKPNSRLAGDSSSDRLLRSGPVPIRNPKCQGQGQVLQEWGRGRWDPWMEGTTRPSRSGAKLVEACPSYLTLTASGNPLCLILIMIIQAIIRLAS